MCVCIDIYIYILQFCPELAISHENCSIAGKLLTDNVSFSFLTYRILPFEVKNQTEDDTEKQR